MLHVWDLKGPSDTWAAQLEAYYKAQPVFALVSGLGNASWRPIHDFSERFEVPCIFPQVDVPVLAERDFYTVYLSRGITLEAQALAQYLRDAGERGPVTQVFRRSDASAAGADAFREAWKAAAGAAPTDLVLDEDTRRGVLAAACPAVRRSDAGAVVVAARPRARAGAGRGRIAGQGRLPVRQA